MAARTYWKGYLRLSLVSIGVELYSALDRSSSVTMHQIHKPSGRRIRYEKVVPGLGPVKNEEIAKGVETEERDTYVVIDQEELNDLKIPSKHTIDLVQFVGYDEIDPRYFDRPYYVLPSNDASREGFEVVREALRKERKLGIGQFATRGREYLVAIRPCGRGILLETLRYADEVRREENLFSGLPESESLDEEKIGLAEELIERKTAPFNPEAFEDHYKQALQELVAVKRGEKQVVSAEEEPRPSAEVIDLMSALKKSVGDEKKGGRRRASAAGKSSGGGKKSGGSGGGASKKSSKSR